MSECNKPHIFPVNANPEHDPRHGGPYDRGHADAYYSRPFDPHYYTGNTHSSERVEDITGTALEAYTAGYKGCDYFKWEGDCCD